jgi:RNAse (barnase) inhibitor barstar
VWCALAGPGPIDIRAGGGKPSGYPTGEGVTSKADFLVAAARDLRFPDYFGHNWDAFADCLGDFAAPAPGTVLIVDHYDDFARTAPHDWRVALTILKRAAIEREQTTAPLYVFLHGPDAAPDIPAINAAHR